MGLCDIKILEQHLKDGDEVSFYPLTLMTQPVPTAVLLPSYNDSPLGMDDFDVNILLESIKKEDEWIYLVCAPNKHERYFHLSYNDERGDLMPGLTSHPRFFMPLSFVENKYNYLIKNSYNSIIEQANQIVNVVDGELMLKSFSSDKLIDILNNGYGYGYFN